MAKKNVTEVFSSYGSLVFCFMYLQKVNISTLSCFYLLIISSICLEKENLRKKTWATDIKVLFCVCAKILPTDLNIDKPQLYSGEVQLPLTDLMDNWRMMFRKNRPFENKEFKFRTAVKWTWWETDSGLSFPLFFFYLFK